MTKTKLEPYYDYSIRAALKGDLDKLQKLKKEIEADVKDVPKGILICEMARGKFPQYYLSEPGKNNPRKYLKAEQKETAAAIAQNDYQQKMIKALDEQMKTIQSFLKNYRPERIRQIFPALSKARQQLIDPCILPDDAYLELWNRMHKGEANSFPISDGFLTERGETVRSKSEKMIADKFFYANIPYQYEAPLYLDNRKVIYPDFTLINIRTRKTYYFEHFGMMDSSEYCRNALEKIEMYMEYGFYQGESLITSMESSSKGINMKSIEKIIEKYLK